jgi:hypothetical protein
MIQDYVTAIGKTAVAVARDHDGGAHLSKLTSSATSPIMLFVDIDQVDAVVADLKKTVCPCKSEGCHGINEHVAVKVRGSQV